MIITGLLRMPWKTNGYRKYMTREDCRIEHKRLADQRHEDRQDEAKWRERIEDKLDRLLERPS